MGFYTSSYLGGQHLVGLFCTFGLVIPEMYDYFHKVSEDKHLIYTDLVYRIIRKHQKIMTVWM